MEAVLMNKVKAKMIPLTAATFVFMLYFVGSVFAQTEEGLFITSLQMDTSQLYANKPAAFKITVIDTVKNATKVEEKKLDQVLLQIMLAQGEQSFELIPEYKGNGEFTGTITFPYEGEWTLSAIAFRDKQQYTEGSYDANAVFKQKLTVQPAQPGGQPPSGWTIGIGVVMLGLAWVLMRRAGQPRG